MDSRRLPTRQSSLEAFRHRLPLAASWYSLSPRCGALYAWRSSLHWALDGPVKVIDGEVVTVRERPWRVVSVWVRARHMQIKLWPCRAFCGHGFKHDAWWHRCDYVTAENPLGRPTEQELWPDEYDEDGVHWSDKTCFCDMKPEYSICSMHPDEDDE